MASADNSKANGSAGVADGKVGRPPPTVATDDGAVAASDQQPNGAMGPKTMSTRAFHTNQWSHDSEQMHATPSKTNLAAPDPYVKFELSQGRIRETSEPNVYVDEDGLNRPSQRVSDRESLRPLQGELVAGATEEQLRSAEDRLKQGNNKTAATTKSDVHVEPSNKANANPVATASRSLPSTTSTAPHAAAAGAAAKVQTQSPAQVAVNDVAKAAPAGQQKLPATTGTAPPTAKASEQPPKPSTMPKVEAASSAAISTKPAVGSNATAAPNPAQASPQSKPPPQAAAKPATTTNTSTAAAKK